jgi:hypothetical protein
LQTTDFLFLYTQIVAYDLSKEEIVDHRAFSECLKYILQLGSVKPLYLDFSKREIAISNLGKESRNLSILLKLNLNNVVEPHSTREAGT